MACGTASRSSSLDQVRSSGSDSYATPVPGAARRYATLDAEVGHGIRVLVKHDNHLPTNAFKARNAMSFMTALSRELRKEYLAIHKAGLILQIDAPDLAMDRTMMYRDLDDAGFVKAVERHVAAGDSLKAAWACSIAGNRRVAVQLEDRGAAR